MKSGAKISIICVNLCDLALIVFKPIPKKALANMTSPIPRLIKIEAKKTAK